MNLLQAELEIAILEGRVDSLLSWVSLSASISKDIFTGFVSELSSLMDNKRDLLSKIEALKNSSYFSKDMTVREVELLCEDLEKRSSVSRTVAESLAKSVSSGKISSGESDVQKYFSESIKLEKLLLDLRKSLIATKLNITIK